MKHIRSKRIVIAVLAFALTIGGAWLCLSDMGASGKSKEANANDKAKLELAAESGAKEAEPQNLGEDAGEEGKASSKAEGTKGSSGDSKDSGVKPAKDSPSKPQKPGKPSNPSNPPKADEPKHNHNWVAVYDTRQVEHTRQVAWTKCHACGADMTGNPSHIDKHLENHESNVHYGTEYRTETYYTTERYVSGYRCSCGATK